MRKFPVVLTMIFLFVIFSSCAKNEQPPVHETQKHTESAEDTETEPIVLSDYESDWAYSISTDSFCIWKNKVYSQSSVFPHPLISYDLTEDAADGMLDAEVVCNKPGCLHEDSSCMAWIGQGGYYAVDRAVSEGNKPVIYLSCGSLGVWDPDTGYRCLLDNEEYKISQICVYGDYIFGVCKFGIQTPLIRIKKDGSDLTVMEGNTSTLYLSIVGCYENYLYYCTLSGLWRIDIGLDKRTAEQLFSVPFNLRDSFTIADGYLYFSNDTSATMNAEDPDYTTVGIYRMKLSELSREGLREYETITTRAAAAHEITKETDDYSTEIDSISVQAPLIAVNGNKVLYAEDFFYRMLEWDTDTKESSLITEKMKFHPEAFIGWYGEWFLFKCDDAHEDKNLFEENRHIIHYYVWNRADGEVKELRIMLPKETDA